MHIKIHKGFDINIPNAAKTYVATCNTTTTYAVKPTDFVGLVPKLLVEEGSRVTVGSPLFFDKRLPSVMHTSPVNGFVKSIIRGDKRKLLAVVVENDGTAVSTEGDKAVTNASLNELKAQMCKVGLWAALRQRPFGIVPNPDDTPKAIFINACESAPLSPNPLFVLEGREQEFCAGVKTLAKLTNGKVHLCGRSTFFTGLLKKALDETMAQCNSINTHTVEGPHPAGNVGTQIAAIDPINKGETVWTMAVQDVAVLGHWVMTGEYRPVKRFALAGPEVRMPRYYEAPQGICLHNILQEQLIHAEHIRIISGNILTGTTIGKDDFIGVSDTLVSVIPEGDNYDFMGWLLPGVKKLSFSNTFLSGFLKSLPKNVRDTIENHLPPAIDTNVHGGVRPLVFNGNFEKVFPFRIYPLQLIKAAIIGDIELMENLGIYEVEPEDFALCEFMDPSKTEIQDIIRQALETIRKESL